MPVPAVPQKLGSGRVENEEDSGCWESGKMSSKKTQNRLNDNFSEMNPIQWLRERGRELVRLKDTSHAIALGTAVGMFFGFMPLWGFKTLLALGLSRLLGANLLATAIATTFHDIALPLMPLLLRWEYQIGYWILSHPHELPPSLRLSHYSPSVWFHWSTFLTVGRPLLLGSIVFATPVAIATYFVTLVLVQRAQPKTSAATQRNFPHN